MKVKFKKLVPEAQLPTYAHTTDSGMDVRSITRAILQPGDRMAVPTGLAVQLESGWELQVRPRSGLAFKDGITVLNSPGTIDQGFLGEIKVILINASKSQDFVINVGDRIAQLVLAPVIHAEIEEVQDLSETDRGVNGFGSSGVS